MISEVNLPAVRERLLRIAVHAKCRGEHAIANDLSALILDIEATIAAVRVENVPSAAYSAALHDLGVIASQAGGPRPNRRAPR